MPNEIAQQKGYPNKNILSVPSNMHHEIKTISAPLNIFSLRLIVSCLSKTDENSWKQENREEYSVDFRRKCHKIAIRKDNIAPLFQAKLQDFRELEKKWMKNQQPAERYSGKRCGERTELM